MKRGMTGGVGGGGGGAGSLAACVTSSHQKAIRASAVTADGLERS